MLIISSKQIGSVEFSVLLSLGFHECFKNLLKISCWWWSLSCPHGTWTPRFLGINYNRLPICRHLSAVIFFCLSMQAAHMLCTRHVGSLPRNCPLSTIQCVQQWVTAWMDVSLNPAKLLVSLFQYWYWKYHNWGRSWAEVNGWLDGPAPCFHLKKD